jgi:hypothetical protein
MRLALSIAALIIYLVSFNLYMVNITNPLLLMETKKLWYCYTTGLILTFYTIDGWHGYKSFLHEAVSKLTMITVIVNFMTIALTHHGIIQKPILVIVTYNLIWLIISLMILVSSWRNGLLKK